MPRKKAGNLYSEGNGDKKELFLYNWNILTRDIADLVEQPVEEFQAVPGYDYSADYAFPIARLLVEVDGGQWLKHGGRHNRDSDREKLNRSTVEKWYIMRFSTQQLETDPRHQIQLVLWFLGAGDLPD